MMNSSAATPRKQQPTSTSPPTLLDLTSLIVSNTYPFQTIEDRYRNIIPEPVQKSIIYHSFPKQESQVLVYASSEFNENRYGVDQVVQIGFHVSGLVYEVSTTTTSKRRLTRATRAASNDDDESGESAHQSTPPSSSLPNVFFKVSATFDRGKITSVSCNCENENSLIFWCDHVIALALHRIRKCVVGVDFVLRVPISETLLQLNRSQLQKLVQYLISDHTDVLPTAQRLADEILFMKTDDNFINRIHGAPDPTAGPSPTDPHSWALNESQIQTQVRTFLSSPPPPPSTSSPAQQNPSPSTPSASTSPSSSPIPPSNVIQTLIEKIYKMIQSQDSNAERILQIITNELVRHASKTHTSRSTSTNPISNAIWDQIIRIWNVIVLKPGITESESLVLESILTGLCKHESLPESEEYVANRDQHEQEDELSSSSSDESSTTQPKKRPKLSPFESIFKTPLNLLQKRTNLPDYQIQALHSKVCHGNHDTDYALAILATLRRDGPGPFATVRLENAHLLFNVLRQSHPKEAYEAALIGLTTPAQLKPTAYIHEKQLKLVEKLIGKLAGLPCQFPTLLGKYVENVIVDGQESSFPLISFASYVFGALGGSELAYKMALRHLNVSETQGGAQCFVHTHLEAQQITLATSLLTCAKDNFARLDEISSTLMRVVKSNTNLFRLAQEVFKHATNENLISVAFNIALHVVKATKHSVHRRRWEMVRWVVSCGLEIGVSKLFYLVRNWGEYFSAVEAVGSVASNILAWVGGGSGTTGGSTGSGSGSNVILLVAPPPSQQPCNERGCSNSERGGSSATAREAGGVVSSKLGNVDIRILEELGNSARNLAIQCAKNDPQNCALNTLTLCETDPMAFETSYQIVLESASKEFLTPQQIFTIARYMEHRGYTQRAYRLAVIAVQHVHIGYNQDTHSLISEIHWTCNLSHQLSTPIIPHHQQQQRYQLPSQPSSSSSSSTQSSKLPYNYRLLNQQPTSSLLQPPTTELENLIPLLIRNIKCATVLTEILRRSITIMTSYENAYQKGSSESGQQRNSSSKKLKQRVYEKLNLLIEGTIDSYITTTHSRLVHISPRHYSDFIEFLSKARENFLLAPNGNERFKHLVESMKCTYKGKKKLLFLLTERFG